MIDGVYAPYAGTLTWGDYNIDSDPLFVVDDELYHLQATSPCIDTGDNSVVGTGETDINGDDRILDGDGDQTADVDMGSDEYNPNP